MCHYVTTTAATTMISIPCTVDPPNVTTTNNLMESFKEDNTLTLSCSFTGIPTVSQEWLLNGQPLSNNNQITITNAQSDGTSTLQWMNVPLNADGIFSCVATNNLGSDRLSINVQILSKCIY